MASEIGDRLITLEDIKIALEAAPRIGEEKDEPEGVRYIQVSDTLAKRIVRTLELIQGYNASRL